MENGLDEVAAALAYHKNGGTEGWSRLIPLVYQDLRRLAAVYLRSERPEHTLQPTALVHETYLRLVQQRALDCQSREHFFGVAAHLMRLILVDHARGHGRVKRQGQTTVFLETGSLGFPERNLDLELLDQALTRLAELDPRQSRIVEMRYFGGLTIEETAVALGVSPRTVKRDWTLARAWLHGELKRERP